MKDDGDEKAMWPITIMLLALSLPLWGPYMVAIILAIRGS